jgi:murein endopeptidase
MGYSMIKDTICFFKQYAKDDKRGRQTTRTFYKQSVKNALFDIVHGDIKWLKDVTPAHFHKATFI